MVEVDQKMFPEKHLHAYKNWKLRYKIIYILNEFAKSRCLGQVSRNIAKEVIMRPSLLGLSGGSISIHQACLVSTKQDSGSNLRKS